MKIMDGRYEEAKMAFEAGADIVTVLAVFSPNTIRNAVVCAKEFGKKVMADMIEVKNIIERAELLCNLGADYICVHTAVDNQKSENPPDRIFVDGAGRSGYMMRCFAMRLMHIGFPTCFLGETVTPGAREKDILIIGSGSGETGSLVARAKKAKKIGCKMALITISGCCSLGSLADWVIEIPAPTAKKETEYKSIQPMGNLFEQALFLTCEIMIMKIMEKTGISSDEMFKNHANLE